jgi:lysocardiolipin and lysophospholipid acyltransferase
MAVKRPQLVTTRLQRKLRSNRLSLRKGLPVLQHVLLPRGKGIHASLQGLEGHLQAVYDLTIIYEGVAPTIAQIFLRGGYTIRFHAVRYDIKDVPTRERDLNAWLLNIFIEKDKLMAKASGAGFDTGNIKNATPHSS